MVNHQYSLLHSGRLTLLDKRITSWVEHLHVYLRFELVRKPLPVWARSIELCYHELRNLPIHRKRFLIRGSYAFFPNWLRVGDEFELSFVEF